VKLQSDRLNEVAEGLRDAEARSCTRERLAAIDDQLSRTEIRARKPASS